MICQRAALSLLSSSETLCMCAEEVNVGVVSLDQEKAFDRVDRSYLFSAVVLVLVLWFG